ncbi:MAG: hypothetical protein J6V32_04810 [Elusimicrobiaceae bacterium]|nr:hypothetical protein [Elusimicrobiaceae bacterium]
MKILRLVIAWVITLQLCLAPLAGAETLPYSLVDKDQYAIFEQEQAAKQEAELALEDPPDDAALLHYSEAFWRQAVTAVDGAYKLDNGPEPIPDLTLLNPTLSLPLYGTSIALTGRYVFGLKMAQKKYKEPSKSGNDSNKNQRSVELNQQMQLKMQGKIMDRVFVDIDYDDQREDEKTLSVAYRGKPGEIVQLAEFGDIDLALPRTEFISYQKQLFGAKMHLQHKNANLYLIGSQTKGTSKQKTFVGSSVQEIVSLKDTDYIRRTYYDLTFGGIITTPITPGTEEIYLDSNNSSTSQDFVPIEKSATDFMEDPSVSCPGDAACYTSQWERLSRGIDYTVDYARGMVIFKRSITAASVLAIDYQTNGQLLSEMGGVPNTIKLIKTENDKPWGSGTTADKMEMKTFYRIGAQNITQDNGRGNFVLVLLDANGQAVGESATPPQVYPTTIDMDFDKGIFELRNRMTDDAGIYNITPVSSKNRTFKIQYESTVKTYFVEAGMVVQSERVKLNGRTLTRNNDYFIDYSSGFITFYKGDEITENSVIDITYDTVTGSSTNNSVLGGRLDYKLFDKIVMGSTVLQEGGEKPVTVPQVGAYSKELLVYGADIQGRDIKLAEPVSVDFGAEIAHSQKKQNMFGYAMIDSMNDTNEQVGGSMLFKDWILAANPNSLPNFLDAVRWDSQDLPSLEINPRSIANADDKQQVLIIDYDFSKGIDFDGRDEVSIVYPISKGGVDLSSKTSFELTMLGEEGGPQVNFTFGNISEYSDNSIGMNTQCGTNVPKTEDIYCRNSLAPNEDIGWLYTNPDNSEERYNPFVHNVYNPESQPNGRIDTQDLNGNGKFDEENIPVDGNFGFAGQQIAGMEDSLADNTTWQTFSMPFTIADKTQWTAIRHVRITLKKGTKTKGQIKIANVALAGTSWNTEAAPSEFSVSGINNVEDTDYEPIFNAPGDGQTVFNYLYGSIQNYRSTLDSANVLDQALRLKFNTTGWSEVVDNPDPSVAVLDGEHYTNRNFKSMDFSQHREFRFLLHSKAGDNTGAEFFLKVGTQKNYDKIIVPLDFDGWRLISVKMVDTNGDHIPDAFVDASDPGYGVKVVNYRVPNGLLNFREISLILAGVQKPAGGSDVTNGQVWLNVIHLAEAIVLTGDAYKTDMSVKWEGWGSARAKYKHQDGNFETPLAVSKNQETTEEEYELKITRIKEFPVSALLTRSEVTTPLITDTTNYNTISLLDKGKVERQNAALRGDFIKENLPKIGLEYTSGQTDYQLMKRKDDNRTYGATLSHSVGSFQNITAGYRVADSSVDYDRIRHAESETYYNTSENTQKMNLKFTYQPVKNFSIIPSYSLSKSTEDRTRYEALGDHKIHYPKALTQRAGFTSTWRMTKWLAPSFNYSVNTQENNNLTQKTLTASGVSENVGVGAVKTINRSADGGVSLTLNGGDILPQSKLFSTLVISSGYRMQDADAWSDVDKGFDSRKELWVRKSFKDVGRYGYRRSMTLRDTFTTTQRWNPLSKYELAGMAAPLKTVSINSNMSKTIQKNDQTGTIYDSTSVTLPDLTFSISDLEKFFWAGRWVNNSNLKLRYNLSEQTNIGTDTQESVQYGADLRFMLFNYFDNVFMYQAKESDKNDLRKSISLERMRENNMSAQTSFYVAGIRITPKIMYTTYDKWLVDGKISESSRETTPSLNLRWDFNLPHGLKIPFINRIYSTSNRIIWNTNMSYTDKRSEVEVTDNYKKYDVTTSLDYELSQNLRFTFSGGLTLLQHAYVKTMDYTAYNIAANMTLQF